MISSSFCIFDWPSLADEADQNPKMAGYGKQRCKDYERGHQGAGDPESQQEVFRDTG
jgi:hypothetical protein